MNQLQKLSLFPLLLLLCLSLCLPVGALGDLPRLTDAAGLLSETEAADLQAHLDEASDSARFDIVVVTLSSLDGSDVDSACVQLYDLYHFGYGDTYDGAMLIISMAERDWGITSFGVGQYVLDTAAQNAISDSVVPLLSAGRYYDAFVRYADLTEETVNNARETGTYGVPEGAFQYDPNVYGYDPYMYGYDSYGYDPYGYSTTRAPFNLGGSLLIGLVLSFIVAKIATGSMKSQLKSVRQQNTAGSYVRQNSLNMAESREHFLYSSVARTPKPTNTARSSSRPGGGVRPSGGGSISHGHTSTHGKF